MADEESGTFIDELSRHVSLTLRAVGGRVFVRNADSNDLDRSTIELNCTWSPGLLSLFGPSIRVGDDKHKPFKWDEDGYEAVDEEADDEVGWNMMDCPIMLSLHRVDEKWLKESAAKNDKKPALGRLDYRAPIHTADGVVNEKRPPVTAWVGLGRENFELVRERLLTTETPDFELSIEVEFPRGAVETGWHYQKVTWNGNGSLPVISAALVWRRGDWNSDAQRQRFVREAEPEYKPPREHAELMEALSRLQGSVGKLATPVWIAVIAAIAAAALVR